ncbi:hypothetical protein A2U01_0005534 [Trifolium medium]|uniref:Putative plant transposon protein domain-containing protein n=1 Tax=Trifolium medium TaxID=97028 RepID=A0A392MCB7_9FABA|nr:hypothetical protein [Trifolium medium]
MEPIAKAWANWLVHNFECCSNESEIIMSRCYAIYTIMKGEPISVGGLIARSIKAMVTAPVVYFGHPFVITFLCERLGFPTRSRDDIKGRLEPIGRKFFRKAHKAADIAYAEHAAAQAAAAPPPPPPHQHQFPPHIPHHHQYTNFEMRMDVSQYNMA